MDLQYLPPDKQREEEPDIRKMLLEAIMLVGARCGGAEDGGAEASSPSIRCLLPAHTAASFPRQLTATKAGRHTVREKGTYLVLRELHRWEREPDVLAACEKLIQVGPGTCSTPGWGGAGRSWGAVGRAVGVPQAAAPP